MGSNLHLYLIEKSCALAWEYVFYFIFFFFLLSRYVCIYNTYMYIYIYTFISAFRFLIYISTYITYTEVKTEYSYKIYEISISCLRVYCSPLLLVCSFSWDLVSIKAHYYTTLYVYVEYVYIYGFLPCTT